MCGFALDIEICGRGSLEKGEDWIQSLLPSSEMVR